MPFTPFTRREEYRLLSRLSDAYPLFDDVDALFDPKVGSGVALKKKFGEIATGDPSSTRWQNVYNMIDGNDELVKLLEFVMGTDEGPLTKDPTITSLLTVLKTRDQQKLTRLAEAIDQNGCILFLGPGALRTAEGGQPFTKYLANSLANVLQQNTNDIYFDPELRENLSYIAQRYEEIARKLFQQKFPGQPYNPQQFNRQGLLASDTYTALRNQDGLNTAIYQSVAKLPFKIIINTNPDHEDLINAIETTPIRGALNRECIHGYFSMANGNAVGEDDRVIVRNRMASFGGLAKPGEKTKVLLYNLFGSVENPYSILTTESQFLQFMTTILDPDAGLHFELKREFFDPKYYLFLGFDFDQWYAKIIFNTVLKLDKGENRTVSLFPLATNASNESATVLPFSQANREFFEEEFNMYFVTDATQGFLKKLISIFEQLPHA